MLYTTMYLNCTIGVLRLPRSASQTSKIALDVIASTSPDSQDACKRNVFLYNGAFCEALAVMADGPMVLRTRLRAWFRRWRMYDW